MVLIAGGSQLFAFPGGSLEPPFFVAVCVSTRWIHSEIRAGALVAGWQIVCCNMAKAYEFIFFVKKNLCAVPSF